MLTKVVAVCVSVAVLASGCASVPTGPNVTVLPGTGKNFSQFQEDDSVCRQFAYQQSGAQGSDPNKDTATGAVVGTLLGAALGAAIGAAAGSPGTGAAVGAGVGLTGGTAAGASSAQASGLSLQQRYDAAYIQCMYAKGHQVPVSARGSYSGQPARPASPPPPAPPAVAPPPPPAGTPPPPPPNAGSWSR